MAGFDDLLGASVKVEKIDRQLHEEVLDRFAKLNIKPYTGFVNAKLAPVMDGEEITDVNIEFPENFAEQMLYYGKTYSLLPVEGFVYKN